MILCFCTLGKQIGNKNDQILASNLCKSIYNQQPPPLIQQYF